MNLALFDFDGTISNRDSFVRFSRYLNPQKFMLATIALSPRIGRYLCGWYANYRLKEDFLGRLYGGRTRAEVDQKASAFCKDVLPTIVRGPALARIRAHQEEGDTVVVVSATPRLVLEPWCRTMGLDIIATELEVDEQLRLTGKIHGLNCWGEEKVVRISARFDLKSYDQISAYGDSKGDLPMLRLAGSGRSHFKPFRQQ